MQAQPLGSAHVPRRSCGEFARAGAVVKASARSRARGNERVGVWISQSAHSRARGNPRAKYAGRSMLLWIPAFAGMSDIDSQRDREGLDRANRVRLPRTIARPCAVSDKVEIVRE